MVQDFIDKFTGIWQTLSGFLDNIHLIFDEASSFFPPYIIGALALVLFVCVLMLLIKVIGALVNIIGGAISSVIGLFL